MVVKGKVLLQLFKRKLSNGTKTFLAPKYFSIVKFKKLGFSSLLMAFVAFGFELVSSSRVTTKSCKLTSSKASHDFLTASKDKN